MALRHVKRGNKKDAGILTCALMAVKPMLWRMAGRKTGRLLNETSQEVRGESQRRSSSSSAITGLDVPLQLKYISGGIQVLTSLRARIDSPTSTCPIRAAPSQPVCCSALILATCFSSSLRNGAVSAESGMYLNATNASKMVGIPSTMKSSLQLAMAGWPEVMPKASAPANVVASGAAETKRPQRSPSSFLL